MRDANARQIRQVPAAGPTHPTFSYCFRADIFFRMLAVVISVGHSLSLPQRRLFFFSQVYIGTFCKICTRMFMWPSFALPVRYGILGDLMKHACCKSKLCFKEGISCWLENLHVCPLARAAKDLFRCLLENHSRSGCGSRFATKLRMRSSVVYVVYIYVLVLRIMLRWGTYFRTFF